MQPNPSAQPLPLGARIRALRRGRRLTQRELAGRAGLAEPFLSRVENGRAAPSLRTLDRLAGAMGVTIGDLLGSRPGALRPACPVSHSGRCIAELIYQPGPRTPWPGERYTARQVRLLRLSSYLVQCGTSDALRALETMMRGLMRLPGTRRDARWLRALKPARAGSGRGRGGDGAQARDTR